MLVIVGTTTDTHTLINKVGKESESDCLLGQLDRIFLFLVKSFSIVYFVVYCYYHFLVNKAYHYQLGSRCERGEIRRRCGKRG